MAARLYSQLLLGRHEGITNPAQVVACMRAMQAQEYAMAKWAVGLRLPRSTDSQVEQAFQRGEILRTHVLRPTWHFVHPKDIRWMVKLSAPRVHAKNAYMYRKTGLDANTLRMSCGVLENALQDGAHTREELQRRLGAAGIAAQGFRLSYIMMYAELEGLICSGPRRGKQFTYQLMDAAAPPCPDYEREEMLAMLARKFFASRAPATVKDFAYWSGLTAKEARLGAQTLGGDFHVEKNNETEYVVPEGIMLPNLSASGADFAFLMPDYDEYIMSYQDRQGFTAFPEEMAKESDYSHWLFVNGTIAGTWQTPQGGGLPQVRLFSQEFGAQNSRTIESARLCYARFWAHKESAE